MPSATDKKLWADAADQLKASRERCQSAYKSASYSAEVIAQSHDAIARSRLQIADVDYRREGYFDRSAVRSKQD